MGSAAEWFAGIIALIALVAALHSEGRAKDADRRAERAVDASERAVEAAERAANAQENLSSAFSQWLSRAEKRDQRQWSSRGSSIPMAREGQPYAGPMPSGFGPPHPPLVHWTVDRIQGATYSLRNIGRGAARNVNVKADNVARFDGPPTDVEVEGFGSELRFRAVGSWQTGTPEIVVTWTDDDGEHEWRRIVP